MQYIVNSTNAFFLSVNKIIYNLLQISFLWNNR